MSSNYSATQSRLRAVLQTAGAGREEDNQPQQGKPAVEGEDWKAGPATLTHCTDVRAGHSEHKTGSNTLLTLGPEGSLGGAVLLPETHSDGRDYCRSAAK